MRHLPIGAVAALLTALGGTAVAQTPRQASWPAPFTPLASIPGISQITPITFPSSDDGFVSNIPIGFSFRFLGSDVTFFGLSTNGWIGFQLGSADSSNNAEFGSANPPNAFIAPWWDDLNLASQTLSAATGVLGMAPQRVLILEVSNFSASPNINDGGRFQIWLYEGTSGRFEVRLDGRLDDTYSASSGFEGPIVMAGAFGSFLPCTPGCTAADFNAATGRVFAVETASGPELTGTISGFPRGALPGTTAMGSVTVRNFGTAASGPVLSRLYLSTDALLDASDRTVGMFMLNDVAPSDTPDPTPVTITIPPAPFPAGDYFLILEVDAGQLVSEPVERDNVVVAPRKIANGYDLEPTSITFAGGGNPGATVPFEIEIAQRGAPYTGPLSIEIHASLDRVLDAGATDPVIAPAMVTLDGSEVQRFMLMPTIPALPPGDYYAIAVVDPTRRITQISTFNDTLTSSRPFPVGPDFRVTNVAVPQRVGAAGDAMVTTTLASTGVPYSGMVSYRLHASRDQVLDTGANGDVALGTFMVTLAGQASIMDTRTVTLPSATLPPGAYYILAEADATRSVPELDETNNLGASAVQVLNAVDLRIASVAAPLEALPGAPVRVTAEVISAGTAFSGAARYRVFLGASSTRGAGDIPLYDGMVTISGVTTPIDVTFPLPASAPVRPWRVLVVADPDNLIAEADETNNVAASLSTMTVRGADLAVAELRGAPVGFFGRPYALEVRLSNLGVAAANGFRYAVYLSDNDIIGVTDQQVYVSAATNLAAGESRTIQVPVMLPAGTAAVTRWIGVVADVYSEVQEVSELNNSLRLPDPIMVVPPAADLRVALISAASIAAGGEPFGVTRLIDNLAAEDAPRFEYAYYLSTDATITPQDTLVATRTGALMRGAEDLRTDIVELPGDVMPGDYWLGVIVDPSGQLGEVNESNNVAVSGRMRVYAAPLRFLNSVLPLAVVGVQYRVALFAAGAPIPFTISLARGTLPMGLTLANGEITGTPTREGESTFTLRATAGSVRVEKELTIRVSPPTVPLAIVTGDVPPLYAGRLASFQLTAIGGAPPYTWTMTSTLAAPPGVMLAPGGALVGTPDSTGDYTFEVRVRDALGDTSAKSLVVHVITPRQGLALQAAVIPNGVVGVRYCDPEPVRITAAGGVPPYAFTVLGDGIPGLTLSRTGELCGTPLQAGSFTMLVRVSDAQGSFDNSLVYVTVSGGRELAVTTFSLPRAALGEAYEAKLSAVRGETPYVFTLAQGNLPPGLELAADGTIRGTATSTGTFAFLVEVEDARHRVDAQPLSIEAYDPAAEGDDGCNCTTSRSERGPGSPSIALAALALLALRRTRRKR